MDLDLNEEKFNFGEWVEHNRIIIGSILLLFIVAATVFLLWRENYWKPEVEKNLEATRLEVKALEQKVSDLEAQKGVTVNSSGSSNISANTTDPVNVATEKTSSASSAAATKPVVTLSQVNINTANVTQLDTLSGIGPVLAQRIVDYRTANGPFGSTADIKKVQGIGDKTFEKFKDNITI